MSDIVKIPKILLPKKNVDLSKWAVVACDQYTSEVEYWTALKNYVQDAPSTLDLILPEVYLTDDNSSYVDKINAKMQEYLDSDFFDEIESLILVKRKLNNGSVRLGLMIAVDLEAYEYTMQNDALIKATEKTVEQRLPIRIEIRQNACLELPHIMLLIDDDKGEIIESLYRDSDEFEKVYDFDLNMRGGHITGYKVPNGEEVIEKIKKFLLVEHFIAKYNREKGILFAVGDGNHSLATAKECWNNIKKNLTIEERENHPSRYALVELVNLHDESLVFEPIHRLLIGAKEDFIDGMLNKFEGEARVHISYHGSNYVVPVSINPSDAIKDIQDYIDEYMKNHCEVVEDYIHGDENLANLVERFDAVGIYMPTISKDGFFDYVVRRGVLPRKSFSMGEANDKRYYLEAKSLVKK